MISLLLRKSRLIDACHANSLPGSDGYNYRHEARELIQGVTDPQECNLGKKHQHGNAGTKDNNIIKMIWLLENNVKQEYNW